MRGVALALPGVSGFVAVWFVAVRFLLEGYDLSREVCWVLKTGPLRGTRVEMLERFLREGTLGGSFLGSGRFLSLPLVAIHKQGSA